MSMAGGIDVEGAALQLSAHATHNGIFGGSCDQREGRGVCENGAQGSAKLRVTDDRLT